MKLTKLQSSYQKEVNKLNKVLDKYVAQGYVVNDSDYFKIPKRVTQYDLKRIQSFKPSDMKARAKVVNNDGELVSLQTAERIQKRVKKDILKIEKLNVKLKNKLSSKERSKLVKEKQKLIDKVADAKGEKEDINYYTGEEFKNYPHFKDVVISNFEEDMAHFPEVYEPIMKPWLQEMIRQYGEDEVAEMLEKSKQDGSIPSPKVRYKRAEIIEGISRMMNHMDGMSPLNKDLMMDKLEEMELWEEE